MANQDSNYNQNPKDIDFGKDKETENIYSQLINDGLVSTEQKKKSN